MQSTGPTGDVQGPSPVSEAEIRRHLIERIAQRSGLAASDVDTDRPLEEFGLASRDAVAIAGELEEMLGRSLPATLVWEFPTINRLSVALAGGTEAVPAAPEPPRAVPAVADDEPIAVVGLGCRFPGGEGNPLSSADAYWEFLLNRGDAIRRVPEGRWDAFDDGSPEVRDLLDRTTKLGGFLDDIAGFDAQFFGITPREAAVMDPQQRLVLEVAWEALEHAGIAPVTLRGSRTGVFVGVSAPEYAAYTASDLARLEPFTATGAALSIIANRLSYLLDLRGPSMIVDTACSSSLVSAHLAVQALRRGEADVALAGGVNILLSPTITMTFDQAGGTASDGRCKAFDASADGMVRAEGCGMVVLKRLSDARRDGDRVLALVRASGVNSDGRSNGLVAPNSDAQKALLRDVYAGTGFAAGEVDYVEAHGTGTFLGDPIEAKALGEVLGSGRDAAEPLLLGSAKSNLGHMESAAGSAGLIKTVLALAHRTIPASIHYSEPNPHIPFDEMRLAVVAEATPWPDRGHPARAGVSGFGFGGTNAHVVLEEAPAVAVAAKPAVVRGYLLSDTHADRVRDHAGVLAPWITGTDVPLGDVAATLARRNGRGRARAAVVARDREGLAAGLAALAEGVPHPGAVTGSAVGAAPGGPVFVFSGYGSQRAGMGQRLLEEEAAFAEAIDDLDPLFQEEAGFSLWELLEDGRKPDGPAEIMPVIFGLQVGLARMWQSYGVTPAAVIGHSMGEVAAAVVAGALPLEDGVKVIVRRSKLMTRLVGGGAMAVVGTSLDGVRELAHDLSDVHPAVLSSPRQTVVTGDADQIATVLARAEEQGLLARQVQAEGAGHSPQVDPLLPELLEALADLSVAEAPEDVALPGDGGGVTVYSTALDDPRTPHRFDAAYWAQNLRNPVRLVDAVTAAAEDGHRAFIEINAQPILSHALGETLDSLGGALVAHSLKRAPKGQETDDTLTFHAQLATLAVHGHRLTAPAGSLVAVPPAPWRHEPYWVAPRPAVRADEHPLLGAHVELPGEDRHAWRADVGTDAYAWPDAPQVLPPAAVAEMALAAAAEVLGGPARVTALSFDGPLALAPSTTVTTTATEPDGRLEISARTPAGTWTRLATADFTPAPASATLELPEPAPAGAPESAAYASAVSETSASVGAASSTESAPAGVGGATGGDGGFAGDAGAVLVTGAEKGSRHFRVHPEVFGRCLDVLTEQAGDGPWAVEAIGSVQVYGATHRGGRVRVELTRLDGMVAGAVRLFAEEDGALLLEATGVVLKPRGDLPVPLADKLFATRWFETPLPEGDAAAADMPAGSPRHGVGEPGTAPGGRARTRVVCGRDWEDVTTALAGLRGGAERSAVAMSPADGNGGALTGGVNGTPARGDGASAGRSAGGDGTPAGGDGASIGAAGGAGGVLSGGAGGADGAGEASGAADVVLEVGAEVVDERLVLGVAEAVRVLAAADPVPRLWIAAPGAAAVRDGEAGDPRRGFVRALVRVLGFEHPALRATFVDAETEEQFAAEIAAGAADTEVAYRGGVRFTARLAPAELPDVKPRRIVRRGGAYIVTGGYGGIGLVTARLLAERGAGRIVLSGRSGPSPDAEKTIAELRETGVDVGVVLGDIAAPGVAERLVAAATEGGKRLCGVVHGAAGMDDKLIGDLGPDDLHRVWTPKVGGAWRLHEATEDVELDWWLVHSSAAALLGSPGQASYAAANAALDALVEWRRARGLPGTTVDWGTWAQVGGAADLSVAVLRPIAPEEGREALEALLALDVPSAGVARFDASAALDLFPEIRNLPYFAALVERAPASQEDDGDWPGAEALRTLDPATARRLISERVRWRIATVLGFPPNQLDPSIPLTELGLDSLVAVRIKSGVEHDLGVTVSPAVLLQGASVAGFEEWAAGELGLDGAAAPQAVSNAEEGYVMPRDAAERLAVRIFEDVLGVEHVSVAADFFELGGQDHQADEVVAQLVQELGCELNRSELFVTPTPEHLAEVIRGAEEEAARQIVRPLQARGTQLPFFSAHPAGGTTGVYQQLAAMLGTDQPFFGLERFEDAPSVEERSARYAEHLMEAQPEGPFRLGGWSFGGTLAYETAVRLREAGREVEMVVLFDSGLPLPVDDESDSLARRFAAFVDYVNETYGQSLELSYDELAGLTEDEQFALVMERAAPLIEMVPPAVLTHQLTSHQDTRSLEAYKPRPYDGRVILYKATEPTPWAVRDARYVLDEANGFAGLCKNLEIVKIPGTHHLNLLDPPGVDLIAEHLREQLADGGSSRRTH